MYRESLTRVLEAWMNILTDTENVPKEVVQPIVTNIFNHYLQAHLSPPEGFRLPVRTLLFSTKFFCYLYIYNCKPLVVFRLQMERTMMMMKRRQIQTSSVTSFKPLGSLAVSFFRTPFLSSRNSSVSNAKLFKNSWSS